MKRHQSNFIHAITGMTHMPSSVTAYNTEMHIALPIAGIYSDREVLYTHFEVDRIFT